MVKIEKMDVVLADKAIAESPKRVTGAWKELLATLKKENKGATVKEITRGQVAALIRQAKVEGFTCTATDKYTAVILSPPVQKKKI